MPILLHDGLEFHFQVRGSGVPVVFQHGLGGDSERIFAQVQLPPGFRLICLDCRGHGQTRPLGEATGLSFNQFASDVQALLDHLAVTHAVLGGTSMGAGVALNLALRDPSRVLGLILLRPAWLDAPNEFNLELYGTVAKLLIDHGPIKGRELFKNSRMYQCVAQESQDSAGSLLGVFSDPRALETISRLERIPADAPHRDRRAWRQIRVPTIVLGTRQDPIHPFDYASVLATEIPGAQLRELTSKSLNPSQYTAELNSAVGQFLMTRCLAQTNHTRVC
jgi:pimeloyl-ACP methyl ester carboxylesterase